MVWRNVVSCDRCGTKDEPPLTGWAKIKIIARSDTFYDLCPPCFQFVLAAFKGETK
jgi:hypothetical protein